MKLLNKQRSVGPAERKPIDVTTFMQGRPDLVRHEEFIDLVDILLKDKNARLIPGRYYETRIDEYRSCLITLQGIQVLEQGGYQQKKKNEDAENTRLVDLETYRDAQNERLNRLTFWIVVWTGTAAVYYLVQVLSFFHVF